MAELKKFCEKNYFPFYGIHHHIIDSRHSISTHPFKYTIRKNYNDNLIGLLVINQPKFSTVTVKPTAYPADDQTHPGKFKIIHRL